MKLPCLPTNTPPVRLPGDDSIRVRSGDTVFTFSATDGRLSGITRGDRRSGTTDGPHFAILTQDGPPTAIGPSEKPHVSIYSSGKHITIKTRFGSDRNLFRWIVHPGGRLQLDYRFSNPPGTHHRAGVLFDLPPTLTSKRWLGLHPDLGFQKTTAEAPNFHGSIRDILWMRLDLADDALTVIPADPNAGISLHTGSGPPNQSPAADSKAFYFNDTVTDTPVAGSMFLQFQLGLGPQTDPPISN